ncbi:MAG: hypothetical protein HY706_19950 [Candidatus Hydrogenedentes bacterium]|nr:hypothetical protein [Candidatus Hydrogenedentota bacterium]
MLFLSTIAMSASAERCASSQKILGMYVHQHWPYNHPYAARTWTLDDWRGYVHGLRQLGYNTIMIWPMTETMPDPLTESDHAALDKIRRVIDMLHADFGMTVWIALCPNVAANSEEAAKSTFEERHFFYCDTRINPGDSTALAKFMQRREQLLRPLAKADAFAIIDSDPGGYPGSTNADFVRLLGEHRKLFDRLRPGIELVYWMHTGWEAYCRFYRTGQFTMGTEAQQIDCLRRLAEMNPEPWGIANGLPFAQKLGLAHKVVSFNYGRIEGEPSFPMTNFGGEAAYEGGKSATERGVMGNAQTHCLQLPNTFAFARGAQDLPLTKADCIQFAEGLIPDRGALILRAWTALSGTDSREMREVASQLEKVPQGNLATGKLRGLLFGSPQRFMNDLVLQLRMRAAAEEFYAAAAKKETVKESLGQFVAAAETWQRRHGCENFWWDPKLRDALRALDSPRINELLDLDYNARGPLAPGETPFDQVQVAFRRIETHTPTLLEAMRDAVSRLP